ncbi:MAG: hypothetical protein ACPHRO_14775 [Nannocystaceae bacterium]
MFGPEPLFPRLSLEAAIRDLGARTARARANAVRALPDALATDLDPRDDTADSHPITATQLQAHPRYTAAIEGLRALATDEDGFVRGLSLIGRGRLGDTSLLHAYREGALAPSEREPARQWIRESAMLGLGELAKFTPPPPDLEHDEVLRCIIEGLEDPAPEVRFQAVAVLADAAPSTVPNLLPSRLHEEDEPEVRAQLYEVFLDRGDSPGAVVDAALQTVDVRDDATSLSDPGTDRESLAAARLLASLRRPEAAPRLLEAMHNPDDRDDAIEAMAVLAAEDIPEGAADLARRLTRRWLVPPVTRVRAAYLLARVSPADGEALLERMARSPRASVRDAVKDARAALATLAQR